MTNTISLLGSTGSIGRQTLDVCQELGIQVAALTAHSNIDLLEQQTRQFQPRLVVLYEEKAAEAFRKRISDLQIPVLHGVEGLIAAASLDECDTVVTAVVGMVGLRPTLAAIEKGKRIALANKETLVCAGELVMWAAQQYGAEIIPVDSEHSAIFQCLLAGKGKELKRILLTASGGPFFGKKKEELENMTAKEALAHPTWSMGAKITIDSATLMNKGFEVMEAVHLFGVSVQNVEVVVHRESIVHSMVEYVDHSVIAQLATSDMRDCIQYAVTYPEREPSPVKPLDLAAIGKLTFAKPDRETFPLLDLAGICLEKGGVAGAVLNGANEGAVALFLEGKITFTQISELVLKVVEEFDACRPGNPKDPTLEEICLAGEEAEARLRALA